MTLDQFIDSREKAIRANFKSRHNIGIISSEQRMKLLRSQKRTTVSRFISELKAAKNPLTANYVEKAVSFMCA